MRTMPPTTFTKTIRAVQMTEGDVRKQQAAPSKYNHKHRDTNLNPYDTA